MRGPALLTTGPLCNRLCYRMRATITLSLPAELRTELDRLASAEGVSRSDIIRESLRDLLFLRDFRALRQRLSGKARRRGIFSDEDVFDRVS